jgi:hypothetical protein
MATEQTKRIVHFFLLALVVGIVTFLIPQSIGLGAGGFDSEEVLKQFGFYLAGGIFLLLIVIAFIIELVIKKGDERYGDSIAFADQGQIPHIPFFKKLSSFQLFLLSTIIFGIIFLLITTVRQTSFIGFKTLEQQFTPTAELLFSSLLVPGSENLGMALVIAACLIGLRIWARRINMSKINFMILSYLAVLVGALYWMANHLLRYGGQDFQLGVVFIFGFVMALLTMLTGSFIPALVMHMTNNVFFDMANLFSRDNVLIGVIITLIVLSILYFIIYRKRKNKVPGIY